MTRKRKKAFLGSIIGSAASLIGGTIGSIIGANAQKKQQAEQERLQREQNNLNTAANLANAINGSQDVADSYYDRMSLMKCGGRYRRAAWGTGDTGNVINGVASGLGSIINSAINANTMGNVQTVRQSPVQFQPKQLVRPTYYDRIAAQQNVYKLGGRRISRGGTRKRGKNEYIGKPNKSKNYYVDIATKQLVPSLDENGNNAGLLMEDGPGIVGGGLFNANYDIFYKSPRITSDNEGITQEYETELTPEEEEAFQNWYKSYSRIAGLDSNPDNPAHQYDYRGYWLNELQGGNKATDLSTGHLPDTWKRPGHPTFSNESIYNTEQTPGGRWEDDRFISSWFNKVINEDITGDKVVVRDGNLVNRILPEVTINPRKPKKYKRK